MLRLHLECEQNVSGRNRPSTLHQIPQCSHHVITCFQRPSPPVPSVLMLIRDNRNAFCDHVEAQDYKECKDDIQTASTMADDTRDAIVNY